MDQASGPATTLRPMAMVEARKQASEGSAEQSREGTAAGWPWRVRPCMAPRYQCGLAPATPVGVVTYVTAVMGDGGGRREPAAGCGQRAMHGGDF
jgi:hypothetical protein